eukprot:s2166_g3.t1
MSLEQLLRDPQYQIPRRYRAAPARIAPTGKSELEKNEQFKRQRQKREEEEAVFLANTVDSEEALFTMPQEALAVCQVELAMPESKSQWRAFRRDEQAWAAQMLRKTEVRWSALDNEQKKAFEQAKELEVQQWLQAEATRAVEGHIDPQRAVRMRWVLTFKESGQAKARIVLIGYEDPDLHELVSSSPTMCRRTRQLVLQFAAQKGWKCLKGDIKSAFLQGPASQEARNLYAVPVKELAAAMKIPAGNLVQVRKAAYGLVNAPAEFFRAINGALKELGFQQMRTEPCGWVFKVQDPQTKEFKTAGVICSHVDDFIIAGNEQCPEWHRALEGFFEKFRWSPWEFGAFSHCGIQIRESSDGSKILDHSKYCETLDQIPVESQRGDSDPATPREIGQLRALLGAAQWRAYNTAPMHAAKVGILLSQVSSATARTLREANKLAREIHGQRILSVRINYLPDTPVEEVTFVCWTDAAVANRKDLSSTGGHRLSRPRRPSWMERLSEKGKKSSYMSDYAGVMVTDAKSLYDIVRKGELNTAGLGLKDKYSTLEIMSILERLERGKTVTRWVNSEAQVADALTKPQVHSALLKLLTENAWTLVYDERFVSAKKCRQALKGSTAKDFWACGRSGSGSEDAQLPPFV